MQGVWNGLVSLDCTSNSIWFISNPCCRQELHTTAHCGQIHFALQSHVCVGQYTQNIFLSVSTRCCNKKFKKSCMCPGTSNYPHAQSRNIQLIPFWFRCIQSTGLAKTLSACVGCQCTIWSQNFGASVSRTLDQLDPLTCTCVIEVQHSWFCLQNIYFQGDFASYKFLHSKVQCNSKWHTASSILIRD